MPTRDPKKHKIANDFLSALTVLFGIWTKTGNTASATTYVGVILTEAFYTTNPWLTPQYIVSRMNMCSLDTVRRRLEDLVDRGLADFTEFGAQRVYRAKAEPAEATIQALRAIMPA